MAVSKSKSLDMGYADLLYGSKTWKADIDVCDTFDVVTNDEVITQTSLPNLNEKKNVAELRRRDMYP